MNELKLLNPDGKLLEEVASKMTSARKNKDVWAKRVLTAIHVETIEGAKVAQPGDMLCRGVENELWPQKTDKFLEKYIPTGEIDKVGFERYAPKPGAPLVESTKVPQPFRVIANWGELKGQAGDYVVRSKTDPTDVWIVAGKIYEATYENIKE